MNRIPNLVDIHNTIFVDDKVSQKGHFAPWDLRMFFACLRGNVPRGFANNFYAAEHSVLALNVLVKLVPGFARDIIQLDPCRFQNIHQVSLITRNV